MNIRRLAAVPLALGIVLVPTAALAYGAPGVDATVSDSTPTAGEPFTFSVKGATPGGDVTLTVTTNPATIPDSAITIAGTKSLSKAADASGAVSYTVTLSQAGTYTLTATDVSTGATLATQVVTVVGATDNLAQTGTSNTIPLALGAAGLALVGAGAVTFAVRRRRVHA